MEVYLRLLNENLCLLLLNRLIESGKNLLNVKLRLVFFQSQSTLSEMVRSTDYIRKNIP